MLNDVAAFGLSPADVRDTHPFPGRGACLRRRDLLLIVPMPMIGVVAAGTMHPGVPGPLAWVGLCISALALISFLALQRARPS